MIFPKFKRLTAKSSNSNQFDYLVQNTTELLPHFVMRLSPRTAERNPIRWNLSAVCAHGETSNHLYTTLDL